MLAIENHIIESAILKEVTNLKKKLKINEDVEADLECKPGVIGIRSQVLLSVMGSIEENLNITIPHNCYIFRDSDGIRELTIKEAAEKLKKIAKNAK
jgi:hypothetical protein